MLPISIIPYAGFGFWAISCLSILTNWIVSHIGNKPLVRNLFMIAVSYLVISSSISHSLFLFLMLTGTIVYFVGKTIAADNGFRHAQTINIATIIFVIFVLCFFKYEYFQNVICSIWQWLFTGLSSTPKTRHLYLVGVSYFSFKFIHFLVECYKSKIKDFNLLTFLNYTLFFPSFFSGPINRYPLFSRDIRNGTKNASSSDYLNGIGRIISGMFKKTVIASGLFQYSIVALNLNDPSVSSFQIIISVYAYMFYIYFDFSGYTDMAIGCAKLMGIELPENFNSPFFKRNLQQFWANWHMSLTTWLTDYVYWPLARKIRHLKKLKENPKAVSNICIIITFSICGVWHGDGLNFLIWGLYHGVGLAILNLYISAEKKYFSMPIRKWINKSRTGYVVSNLITFQYVAFGFFLFGCDMNKQLIVIKNIFGA